MKVRAAILREMGRTAPYIESQPLTMETVDLAPPGLGNSVCACWQLVCATQTYRSSTALAAANAHGAGHETTARSSSWAPMWKAFVLAIE